MLQLICGEDQTAARICWRQCLDRLYTERPAAERFRQDADSLDWTRVEELARGDNLFGAEFIVALDWAGVGPAALEFLIAHSARFIASSNIFAVLLDRVPENFLAVIRQNGGQVRLIPVALGGATFNLFPLTDAFGRRDRKQSWLLFHRALAAGLASEEIFWKLWWQIKNLLLVKTGAGRRPPTLKPFVFQKALGFASNFSDDELRALARRLATLYTDSHRGRRDLALGLERLLLEL